MTAELKCNWVTCFTYICSDVEFICRIKLWCVYVHTVVVEWDIHMQCGGNIGSGAYFNNVK